MVENYQRDTDRRLGHLESDVKEIKNSLGQIKEGQHKQDLVNQKMDLTLDSINRERELDKENKEVNRKNIREVKMWILGLVGTIAASLIIAIIRTALGI
ncbi:DUF2951 family protein [Staphylococcus agnetis]|uniref:DUF2951 family protein n=1 Tax=Staphylococcus agnetis TaxID=985762 RepID=UPI000D19D1EC|nr:DUF2951 family protein [Staphylococcus agnetis]PTH38760.1 hypothetical protein BU588_09715 [Staphylococcus agnetis]